MKKTELFYIGEKFYSQSGTGMSSIYKVKNKERYDWGFVQVDLAKGKAVSIRPATKEEMQWAKAELSDILAERIKELETLQKD